MTPAFLTTPRLVLRPLTLMDCTTTYLSWLHDPRVTKYLEVGHLPLTLTALERYVAHFQDSTTDLAFAICLPTGEHIGNVTLQHIRWIPRTAETGLLLGEATCWGQGYAQEAWSALLAYAFDRLGLRKVIAGVVEGNTASLRALQVLGFQQEGRLRDEYLIDGQYQDALRFGVFESAWVDQNKNAPNREARSVA